ncbi:MAG TPA: DNA polymerase III subunit beta [Chloroflexota bacterium]|nr:DNA polymerase III subunit beta [Chloroflexota bacterium]
MDLTVDQGALSRALRLVARVAPMRPTLPILQMVLLAGEPGRLRLTATDAELAMTTVIPAEVASDGRVAIPARLLGEYVAQLPAQPVRLTLEAARHRVRAACGSFVANLATADPDEFPALPTADEQSARDLDAGRLRRALERVAVAAARDESRPVLSAVLFDFGAEGLTLAAADGFRLARTRLPDATATAQQLLVPARAVAEFARLLAETEAARLLLTPDGRGVLLAAGETALYARLIEGRFPDVERVIPQEGRTRVTVDTAAFRQAVRVAGLFGSGDVRPVLLEAMPDRLRVTARGAETGETESALPAALEGEPQAVSLNTRLLADLLDAVATDRLELRWQSPQTPVVVREVEPADEVDVAVVMPLHDPALARRPAAAA